MFSPSIMLSISFGGFGLHGCLYMLVVEELAHKLQILFLIHPVDCYFIIEKSFSEPSR